MGLKMCLVSAALAGFLPWNLRTRRSSCFCSKTRMSSRRIVYSSERKRYKTDFFQSAHRILYSYTGKFTLYFLTIILVCVCVCTNCLVFIDFPGERSFMHHLPLGQVQILQDKNRLSIETHQTASLINISGLESSFLPSAPGSWGFHSVWVMRGLTFSDTLPASEEKEHNSLNTFQPLEIRKKNIFFSWCFISFVPKPPVYS